MPGIPDAVFALDEFSPLVEATLFPTLALAEAVGGMYEVFSRWLAWVHSFNDGRAAASYRRGYGSPTNFAKFVLEELQSQSDVPTAAVDVARVLEINLRIAAQVQPSASTTMASHRSLSQPKLELDDIRLDTPISRGPILASVSLDHDVTPALSGQTQISLDRTPTFLVWLLTAEDEVRLLCVDSLVYDAIETISTGSSTVGDLILNQIAKDGGHREAETGGVDPGAMFTSLVSAAQEGLIMRVD